MAYILAQAGDTLYRVDPSTGTATAVTLPTGVTVDSTRKPKFAVLNQFVVVVNSPSRNLMIDPEGTCRVLVPKAPISPVKTAASSGAGNLTGAYLVRQSFVVEDSVGNLISESALSPASISVTLTAKDLAGTFVAISEDSITKRRIYRTTAGGTTYYQWLDIDGNTVTAFQDGLADAALSLLPAQPSILSAPPGTYAGTHMRIICAWKNRLWGAGDDDDDVDTVRYTEDGKVYAWPNSLTAYPKGADEKGVVGFAPRKDQLGLLKRNGVWQVTGNSSSDFRVVQLTDGVGGCIAADSVVVINDRAYWLGNDGVYEWSAEGIKNISDESVKPWFTKGTTYFNESRFSVAFARHNKARNSYELHLAANGSSVEDRWVSFNLTNRRWYGPHKTDAFTPTHAAGVLDSSNIPLCLVGGSDGKIYQANSTTATDGASTAIDMDCYQPYHHMNAPDVMHTFLQLSVNSKIEAGGTLTITPNLIGRSGVGVDQATVSHDLTKGHEVLRRLGDGRMVRLRFRENTNAQKATIYGYELPGFEIGRR
jgi:hypothetical protein